MRKAIVVGCLVLLAAATALAVEGPKVVSTVPAANAKDVRGPEVTISVRYSEPMKDGSWSFVGVGGVETPKVVGEPWFSDPWTVNVKVRVEPGRTYGLGLNDERRRNFVSADGKRAAAPFALVFGTAASFAEKVDPASPPGPSGVALRRLGPPRHDPDRRWTVMVYMCADNDLERFALKDLNEMEAGLPAKGVEVIVLVDRAKGFDDADGDWTGARVYRIRPGRDAKKIESEVLLDIGEADMGSPLTLEMFLTGARNAFPAPRTALVMWNHGSGWSGHADDFEIPGDEKAAGSLTLPELGSALTKGLGAPGVPRLDLIAFDMCLMGQLEVAVTVGPHARYLVASEALEPGDGYPYDTVLPEFAGDREPREVAVAVARRFGEHYDRVGDPSATTSAVDLSKVPAVTLAFQKLIRKLAPEVGAHWPAISRSLFFAESYLGRGDFRKGQAAIASVDLLDMTARLRLAVAEFPAEPELEALEETVSAAVLHSYAGARRRLSRGLSVYAPVREDLFRKDYGPSAGTRLSDWAAFLKNVHAVQKKELTPPKITDAKILDPTGAETDIVKTLGGNHVKFKVTGKNILWALASQVRRLESVDGYAVMYRTFLADPRFDRRKAETAAELSDLVLPEYVDGENELMREVGVLVFQVTDGKTTVDATIDYSDIGDLAHARVPAIYEHPSLGRALADVYFDVNWSVSDGVVIHVPRPDGSSVAQMIEPKPDAEITLLYEVITKTGETKLAPTGKLRWGDGLRLVPKFQEPGRYAMLLEAESIAGVSDSAVVGYRQESIPGLDRLLAATRSFTAMDLVGKWTLATGVLETGKTELTFRDTGATFTFTADPKRPSVLPYALTAADGSLTPGLVIVDARGAPSLIYMSREKDGRLVRTDFHLVFRIDEGGQPAYLLKDIVLGGVYKLRRAVAESLAGTWEGAEGVRLVLTDDTYRMSQGGELIDEGKYEAAAGRLTARSAGGSVEILSYERTGDRLVLVDEDGQRLEFTKVK